jgi:hypothetical protein
VIGYAQASTSQNRWKGIGVNQAAIDDYGILQANMVFMGQRDPSAVSATAQVVADTRGRPVKMARRIVLDEKDAFSYLQTGNCLTIKETAAGFAPGGGFGFNAQAKILSVEYNDLSNKVPLNVEII